MGIWGGTGFIGGGDGGGGLFGENCWQRKTHPSTLALTVYHKKKEPITEPAKLQITAKFWELAPVAAATQHPRAAIAVVVLHDVIR